MANTGGGTKAPRICGNRRAKLHSIKSRGQLGKSKTSQNCPTVEKVSFVMTTDRYTSNRARNIAKETWLWKKEKETRDKLFTGKYGVE
jgi:hypothetical protein